MLDMGRHIYCIGAMLCLSSVNCQSCSALGRYARTSRLEILWCACITGTPKLNTFAKLMQHGKRLSR